jgi:hypothetical protein
MRIRSNYPDNYTQSAFNTQAKNRASPMILPAFSGKTERNHSAFLRIPAYGGGIVPRREIFPPQCGL